MPTYTVLCASKSSGTEQALLIWAQRDVDAESIANAAGFVVSTVTVAIPDAPAPYPPPAELLTALNRNLAAISSSNIVRHPSSYIAWGVIMALIIVSLLGCIGFVFVPGALNELRRSDPSYNNRYR